MTQVMDELPGIDRIRKRFVAMLADRQTQIAGHGLAAWDGKTVAEINGKPTGAQAHQHQCLIHIRS